MKQHVVQLLKMSTKLVETLVSDIFVVVEPIVHVVLGILEISELPVVPVLSGTLLCGNCCFSLYIVDSGCFRNL